MEKTVKWINNIEVHNAPKWPDNSKTFLRTLAEFFISIFDKGHISRNNIEAYNRLCDAV